MTHEHDTTEKGLEELIIRAMTGRTDVLVPAYKPTEQVPRCPAEQAGFSEIQPTTTRIL